MDVQSCNSEGLVRGGAPCKRNGSCACFRGSSCTAMTVAGDAAQADVKTFVESSAAISWCGSSAGFTAYRHVSAVALCYHETSHRASDLLLTFCWLKPCGSSQRHLECCRTHTTLKQHCSLSPETCMADETLRGILVNLGDKDDNKRKKAEKDMFDHLRGFLTPEAGSSQAANINEKVTLLIANIVQDFCRSAWPSQRTSGLRAQQHAELLTDPVLVCFSDEDALVRYKACEAFYNIAKVIRAGILRNISGVFDGLCRLYTDVEQNIKEGAQSLDRLIRDIVMEQRHFDFAELIPLITCRIHILNPNVRQLVLGWIVLLDSLPQVDMISFLPHFLEGLFSILASENRNFRMEAQACLESIWGHIQRSAVDRPERTQQAIAEAASTVARCCRAGNEQRSEAQEYMFVLCL
eukprot:s465_g27.t1